MSRGIVNVETLDERLQRIEEAVFGAGEYTLEEHLGALELRVIDLYARTDRLQSEIDKLRSEYAGTADQANEVEDRMVDVEIRLDEVEETYVPLGDLYDLEHRVDGLEDEIGKTGSRIDELLDGPV